MYNTVYNSKMTSNVNVHCLNGDQAETTTKKGSPRTKNAIKRLYGSLLLAAGMIFAMQHGSSTSAFLPRKMSFVNENTAVATKNNDNALRLKVDPSISDAISSPETSSLIVPQNDDTNDDDDDKQQRHDLPTARICWMGVDQDWETGPTYETIIKPLEDAGYQVELGIFLQGGRHDPRFPPFREPYSFSEPAHYQQSFYINKTYPLSPRATDLYDYPNKEFKEWYDPIPLSTQEQDQISSQLNSIPMNTNRTRVVHLQHYAPLLNPPLSAEYVHALASRDGGLYPGNTKISKRSLERFVWRGVNHVRALESHQRCGAWLKQQQQQKAANNNIVHPDNLVIRLGEDTRLLQPLIVSRIQRDLQSNQLLTIPAYTSRGHDNDQVEIFKVGGVDYSSTRLFYEALTQVYPGMYQNGVFITQNYTTNTLGDYLQQAHEYLGIEVLVWNQTSSRGEHDDKLWDKILSRSIALPFNLSTAELPVQYPLSKDGHITFAQNHTAANTLSPPSPTARNNTKKKSALVCITGQRQRLELKNKVQNLLAPMNEQYDIDIVVVSTGGAAYFQQEMKAALVNQNFTFHSESDVRDYLEASNITFGNIILRTYSPSPALPINPQFLISKTHRQQLFRKKAKSMPYSSLDYIVEQTIANTRMMQSYQHCYTKHAQDYDLYVRLRDDIGFTGTVPPAIYSSLPPGHYMVPNSRSWDGINDRMAFVAGPQAALCYFQLPAVMMFSGWMLDSAMKNTESYFKRIYWRMGCPDPLKRSKEPVMDVKKMLYGEFLEGDLSR